MSDNEYPTEDPVTRVEETPQEHPPADDGNQVPEQEQDDEYPVQDDDDDEYPVQDDDNPAATDDDDAQRSTAHSESCSEKYARRCREADSVWFSGYFTGAVYLPKPQKLRQEDLDESIEEELLEEKTYNVPYGYKYHEDNLPPILSEVPLGKHRTGTIVFIALSVVGWIFLLCAACPVPWFKGRNVTINGVNFAGRKYTLYWHRGGSQPDVGLRGLRGCPIEKQFYQSIAASTIMACVFSLLGWALGAARLCGRNVGYGWPAMFTFFSFGWGLCGNAMSISMYFLSRCDQPRYSHMASFDAGFVLSLIGWVFQLVALLVIVASTKLNVGPSLRDIRVMDTWFVVMMLAVIALAVIGNATTIWKRRFNSPQVTVARVTYWHTELIIPGGTNIIYGRAHYRCGAYNKRIKASISFLILGTVTAFLSSMCGIGAFGSRMLRILGVVFAVITWANLFISWVTSVAIKYRTLCDRPVNDTIYEKYPGIPSGVLQGLTEFRTYGLAEGVALPIVAWVITTAAIVANIVVPWPAVAKF